MDPDPLGDVDDQHAARLGVRHRHTIETGVQRGVDLVGADLLHEVGQRVQPGRLEGLGLAVVVYPKDQPASLGVGKRGERVREIVAPRRRHAIAAETDFLQFEVGVVPKSDLLPKAGNVDGHGVELLPAGRRNATASMGFTARPRRIW